MNYQEARCYIDETMKYGSVLGLATIRELLRRLDHPQDKLKIIHIAGTNGKGSALAYISTILTEAGFRVGRYISPVIFSYRERIQINEAYITKEAFAELVSVIRVTIDSMIRDGFTHPTAFEIETALSFMYFLRESCDFVVLETGLGGRDDATNVMKQVVCSVITSISLDHMQYLGETVEEIASHKAGIIKENCPVILYHQKKEVEEVIYSIAKDRKSIVCVTKPESLKVQESVIGHQAFSYETSRGNLYKDLEIKLNGSVQLYNACTAIETVELLKEQGYVITEDQIRTGLKSTVWRGRLEQIGSKPLFLVDGAHNPDAAERLREAIITYLKGKRIVYIMGVLADKDYQKIIASTAELADFIITFTPDNPRALHGFKLAKEIREQNPHVEFRESLESAVDTAYEAAGQEDVILAFGSLSYLGELTRIVNHR